MSRENEKQKSKLTEVSKNAEQTSLKADKENNAADNKENKNDDGGIYIKNPRRRPGQN